MISSISTSVKSLFRQDYRYESLDVSPSRKRSGLLHLSGRKKFVLTAALALSVLVYLPLANRQGTFTKVLDKIIDHPVEAANSNEYIPLNHNAVVDAAPSGNFHLLIPADHSDTNLCKAVLSASLNDYPIPTIYTWGAQSATKMEKITGAWRYLKTLDSSHDEDLVLVIDGYDVWFQLPVQILIDRYHEINEEITKHLRPQSGAGPEPFRQSIIFSSQKKCWPGEPGEVSCDAAPESLLPEGTFGPHTDELYEDEKDRWQRMRSRYLNAGFIMGPVKQMRQLFDRGEQRARLDYDIKGHDQAVLATIWGEQEFVRANGANDRRTSSAAKRNPQEDATGASIQAFVPQPGEQYEFEIGLDYNSSLCIPTVFSEFDLDWIKFGEPSSIEEAKRKNNVSADPSQKISGLPDDIASLPAPFDTISKLDAASSDWNDVHLFTNLYTGITPAIVHHNAHRDGMKSRRESQWPLIWFQKFARALLNSKMIDLTKVDEEGQTPKPQDHDSSTIQDKTALLRSKRRMIKSLDEYKERPIAVDKYGKKWYSSKKLSAYLTQGFGVQTLNSSTADSYAPSPLELPNSGSELWNTARGDAEKQPDDELDRPNEINIEWGSPADHGYGPLIREGDMEKRRGDWLTWGDLCISDFQDLIFTDGQGDWRMPDEIMSLKGALEDASKRES